MLIRFARYVSIMIDYLLLKHELLTALSSANTQGRPLCNIRVILKWCEDRTNEKFGSYSPAINGIAWQSILAIM